MISRSPDETRQLAEEMGKNAAPGEIYALTGPLGAGKTVFAQGFARGLGYDGPVTSPTFTLMNIYEGGRLTLYHFDLYRLSDGDALEGIGYEDYFYADGVSLVEWAERAADLLPENTRVINLLPDYSQDGENRLITITKRNDAPLGGSVF